ncbi:MAG: hypothetical protein WDZ79_02025 [Candidatus Paceibacterota bacterium]
MGLKNYIMRKVMKAKLKDAPPQQQEMIMGMVENNPELFAKISKEIKQEMKNGRDQMAASMLVMKKYQKDIQKALQKNR